MHIGLDASHCIDEITEIAVAAGRSHADSVFFAESVIRVGDDEVVLFLG